MGEEAIQYARSYALEAERRMGEMLRETERAKGGGDRKSDHRLPTVTGDPDAPTLAELGITKRESVQSCSVTAYSQRRGANATWVGVNA